MLRTSWLSLACLGLAWTVKASEIDSFTLRHVVLAPNQTAINDLLDHVTNARIDDAIRRLNRRSRKQCASEQELEEVLLQALGERYVAGVDARVGTIEHDLNVGQSPFAPLGPNGRPQPLPVVHTPYPLHIYNNFTMWQERAFISSNKFMEFVTFKMVDTDGQAHVVGSDKTSHFFTTGMEYLTVYRQTMQEMQGSSLPADYQRTHALMQTLQHGITTEVGTYGMGVAGGIGTGVYSFADLSANYAGLQFWSRLTAPQTATNETVRQPASLLDHPEDKRTSSPVYFQCVNGTWQKQRPFRWSDYVTSAWDEAMNPVEFKSQDMKQKFQQRIQMLFDQGQLSRNQLPLNPSVCKQLKQVAPDFVLHMTLHPSCYAALHS